MTPPTSDQPRPVWLTLQQRNMLWGYGDMDRGLGELADAWDAAPADPVEAAIEAARECDRTADKRPYPSEYAKAVLRSLGAPNTNQEPRDA